MVAFILEGFLFRIQCSRVQTADHKQGLCTINKNGANRTRTIHVSTDTGEFIVEMEVGKLEVDFLCARGDSIREAEMTAATETVSSVSVSAVGQSRLSVLVYILSCSLHYTDLC